MFYGTGGKYMWWCSLHYHVEQACWPNARKFFLFDLLKFDWVCLLSINKSKDVLYQVGHTRCICSSKANPSNKEHSFIHSCHTEKNSSCHLRHLSPKRNLLLEASNFHVVTTAFKLTHYVPAGSVGQPSRCKKDLFTPIGKNRALFLFTAAVGAVKESPTSFVGVA